MDPWLLMQLADSALPTGGFAHSGGLEAAAQLGRVGGGEDLERFAVEAVWSAASSSLPFVLAVLRAPARLEALDLRLDAAIPGHVANRASRAQGRALLRGARALAGAVAPLEDRVRAAGIPGHLATVGGALVAALGGGEDDAARLHLFALARGIVSAGVRLGIAGPIEAQGILARVGSAATAAAARTRALAPEDAAPSAPLLDLLQSHQDRLYSRLFQS